MPDITSFEEVAGSEDVLEPHPSALSESQKPSTPSLSSSGVGGPQKFSYTKNWGEVSNTLRKKLSRRLSALKESDDTSGDDDRTYRSDRSGPDSLLSGTHRSDSTSGHQERSPDQILGEDGVTSVRSSRAAIWQKMAQSAADAARSPVRLNRAGTAFQGVQVTLSPRSERLRRDAADQPRSISPHTRPGSGTPEKAEYRSLAAFIARAATPERLSLRLQQQQGRGRGSRPQTPERTGQNGEKYSPRTTREHSNGASAEQYSSSRSSNQKSIDEMAEGSPPDQRVGTNGIASSKTSSSGSRMNSPKSVKSSSSSSRGTGEARHSKQARAAAVSVDDDIEEEYDEDDEQCDVCEFEARQRAADEEHLDLLMSARTDVIEQDPGTSVSTISRSDSRSVEAESEASLVAAGAGRSPQGETGRFVVNNCDETLDLSEYLAKGATPAVTHFVEVTNIEDGKKRITYVENGVTVAPVLPKKGKGSSRRKISQPRPDIIEEEDEDKNSLTSLTNDAQSQMHVSPVTGNKVSRESEPVIQDKPNGPVINDFNFGDLHHPVPEKPRMSQKDALPHETEAHRLSSKDQSHKNSIGKSTGAVPKRRDRNGTRVVKFPKEGSRRYRQGESPGNDNRAETKPLREDDFDEFVNPHVNGKSTDSASDGSSADLLDSPTTPGTDDDSIEAGRGQQRSPTSETDLARGNVARRQALYESISEINASKRLLVAVEQTPPALPAGRPSSTAVATATAAPPSGRVPDMRQGATVDGKQDAAAGSPDNSSSACGSTSSDTDGSDRNYRLRRSALEALPLRIPQIRELITSRFRTKEAAETTDDLGTAPEADDLWTASSLAAERVGAESDGDSSDQSGGPGCPDDGKHSLLQFAMLRFRDADEKYNMLRDEGGSSGHSRMVDSKNKKNKKKTKEDWTWREQVEAVKWTDQPIRQSLLKLDSSELNRTAVECFIAILRYMGDQAMPRNVAMVDCVYTVLMACHRYSPLRDEVYCQLMRQTTSNRSPEPDSCTRGWRLLSLVAAYFSCSSTLRPFLVKYLETVAGDERRACHGTALVCLHNLRRTRRYGGRKNVPSEQEIAAVTAGRTARRQRFLLPGGTERVVSTRVTTVVQDIVDELCRGLDVLDEEERQEFCLYCVIEGDSLTIPLARDEYVTDVTTELQKNSQAFHLLLCRSVHVFPLRLEAPLYVETVFSQTAPDYLEGLLLVMPAATLQQRVVFDIARIAALLHRAADLKAMPTMRETKYLLPKAALMVRDIKPPQWVNMVQDSWTEVRQKTPTEAKVAVLDTLQHWPLFGSSFFVVRRARLSQDPKEPADKLFAINSRGVHLLDTVTHETLASHPFSDVLSTRRVRSEDGAQFLDIKYSSGKQTRITRLQSDAAYEMARLIRQYSKLQHRTPISEREAETRERQVSR